MLPAHDMPFCFIHPPSFLSDKPSVFSIMAFQSNWMKNMAPLIFQSMRNWRFFLSWFLTSSEAKTMASDRKLNHHSASKYVWHYHRVRQRDDVSVDRFSNFRPHLQINQNLFPPADKDHQLFSAELCGSFLYILISNAGTGTQLSRSLFQFCFRCEMSPLSYTIFPMIDCGFCPLSQRAGPHRRWIPESTEKTISRQTHVSSWWRWL